MSLERIIAEQQKKIDDLTEGNKKLIERAAKIFEKNEELFEAMARFLDAPMPPPPMPLLDEKEGSNDVFQRYHSLKHEVRMQMGDAGYCLRCYNFICECDDYD